MLLAHYTVRVLMHQAALNADIDPDRLSFVHALEIVRDAVPEFQQVVPAQQPALYERMLREIASKRLPPRRTRSNPRVVKRTPAKCPRKRAEHSQPPAPQGSFRDAIAVQSPPVRRYGTVSRALCERYCDMALAPAAAQTPCQTHHACVGTPDVLWKSNMHVD